MDSLQLRSDLNFKFTLSSAIMSRLRTLLLGLSLLLVSPAAAQESAILELPDSLDRARAEAAATAPLPDADGSVIEPAVMQYRGTLKMRGRKIEMNVRRTIAAANVQGEAAWRVVDATVLPMGAASDTAYVDRATLRPLRRSMGGMGTVTLTYSDDKITGEMSMGGQTMEVNVDLEAPVLGGGAALELFLAGLPLEAGYTTTLRTFNARRQEVRSLQLEVTGATPTEVPAGTFETYVVELTPLDGSSASTLYVTQDAPHYAVKAVYKLPAQLGGGTMTTVLTALQEPAGSASR